MRRAVAAVSVAPLSVPSPISRQIFGVSLPSGRGDVPAIPAADTGRARAAAGAASTAPAALRIVRREGRVGMSTQHSSVARFLTGVEIVLDRTDADEDDERDDGTGDRHLIVARARGDPDRGVDP